MANIDNITASPISSTSETTQPVRICDDCGCVIEDDDFVETHDGRTICQSCYDSDYFTCDDCGRIYPTDDLVVVNEWVYGRSTQYVCRDCFDESDSYHTCAECGDPISDVATAFLLDDGRAVCNNCSDRFLRCENCGGYVRSEDVECDEDDEPLCPECFAATRHGQKLHNYSYKPMPVFHTTPNDDYASLTMGVELEIDKGDSVSGCLTSLGNISPYDDGLFYCKHDGSLSNGIEIVTHPATLDYHEKQFPWQDICDAAIRNGFRSHEAGTCGLHIHVGRQQLTANGENPRLVIGRIAFLMDKYWDALKVFSRRKTDQLRWCEPINIEYGRRINAETFMLDADVAIERIFDFAGSKDRYHALNLENSRTIEFRLFRGSLKRDTILASLQLVDNICSIARSTPSSDITAVQWGEIVRRGNRHELIAYCTERGILDAQGRELPPCPEVADPGDLLHGHPGDLLHGHPGHHTGITRHTSSATYNGVTFQLGDRVAGDHGVGTIASLENNYIGIAFDSYTGGHTLNNVLPDGAVNGWFCYPERVHRVDNGLSPGQLVLCSTYGADEFDDENNAVNGLIGVVCKEGHRPLVCYPEYADGHEGRGLSTYEDAYPRGHWFTESAYLIPVVFDSAEADD